MDVGAFLGALTGGNSVKIDIRLLPTPEQQQQLQYEQQQQQQQQRQQAPKTTGLVPIDHLPSWKLHRNPFWRVKHPHGNKLATIAPNVQDPHLYPHQQQQSQPPPTIYAYDASQDIGGMVSFFLPPGKKMEHLGIKIQFIGRVDMSYGVHEGRPHYDFVSLSKELAPPGYLYQPQTDIPFLFRNVLLNDTHAPPESYRGRNVSVRYFVKVVVERKFLPPIAKDNDVWIQTIGTAPTANEAIKMEVGIEDCLHIEFEYQQRIYHLQESILGKIQFLLVRIKIKHMELAVIRRETSGDLGQVMGTTTNNPNNNPPGLPPPQSNNSAQSGQNLFTETQTLVKYEIMDGAPVKGEVIPVKLSLRGIPADLTPTYEAVNNRFSVRYFLNLVLVDEEDRRYFKQQEIILWRKELG